VSRKTGSVLCAGDGGITGARAGLRQRRQRTQFGDLADPYHRRPVDPVRRRCLGGVTSWRSSASQLSYFCSGVKNRFDRLPARSTPRPSSSTIRSSSLGR